MITEKQQIVRNAIKNFINQSSKFTGTMSALYSKLMKITPSDMRDSFPGSAAALSKMIKDSQKNLSRNGIKMEFYRQPDGTKIINVYNRNNQ